MSIPWKDIGLAVYVYVIMVHFRTRYSVHHPLEIYLQGRSLGSFLRHPVATGVYENKICPLGHFAAILLAVWILLRHRCRSVVANRVSRIAWGLILVGGLLMNVNVVMYLLPAYIIDTWCH